jgi:hypothetical protein
MYSVVFIMFVGMGLLTANWFIGIGGRLLFTLFAIFRAPREEEMLVKRFGDQYRPLRAGHWPLSSSRAGGLIWISHWIAVSMERIHSLYDS